MESWPLHWLFLDLDSYFASCEQQDRPDLRARPLGVVPMMAETTVCLAASREAKKFGVKTGTLVAEARVRCPGITFVQARHELYTRYHQRILEAVDTCLPIDSVLSIDEMICELTGSQRSLSAALAMADKVKATLRERIGEVLTCSIGLSCNRYLSKLASDMDKPNGMTVLLKEDLPHRLLPLKLRDFPGIGPRMERRLEEHGIRSTQTLLGLSMEEMASLWGGIGGERFYRWLRGEEVQLRETQHHSLGHEHVLGPEHRTSEGAWITAKRLLVKAAVRLRKEGSYACRIGVALRLAGDSSPEKNSSPSSGWGLRAHWHKELRIDETQDTLILLSALTRLWKEVPRATPFKVAVTLSDLVPKTRHQLSLLEKPARENLGEALDRLNAKFGKNTVSVGGLLQQGGAAAPHIAFHRVPDLDEF